MKIIYSITIALAATSMLSSAANAGSKHGYYAPEGSFYSPYKNYYYGPYGGYNYYNESSDYRQHSSPSGYAYYNSPNSSVYYYTPYAASAYYYGDGYYDGSLVQRLDDDGRAGHPK